MATEPTLHEMNMRVLRWLLDELEADMARERTHAPPRPGHGARLDDLVRYRDTVLEIAAHYRVDVAGDTPLAWG